MIHAQEDKKLLPCDHGPLQTGIKASHWIPQNTEIYYVIMKGL